MQWWDDLWLNEGFASWMEGRTTSKLHPEWNNHLCLVAVREAAMGRDAVASTHPVVQQIETVEQANQASSDVLELVLATPLDADTQVWGKIASILTGLDSYYAPGSAAQADFRKFAIGKLSPVMARVGWAAGADEADTVSILRTELIAAQGGLGDAGVIAESRRRFAAMDSDASAIPGPLRKIVLGVVAANVDAATWDNFLARARIEKVPLMKDQWFVLLSSAKDAALAGRALELAMGDEPGATNTAKMIATVAGIHPDLAFDFAVAHREALDERVDFTSRSRYYPGLGAASRDAAMIGKIRAYAKAHLAEGSRRSADTAVEAIEYRIRIQSERMPAINDWLASTPPDPPPMTNRS